MFHDLRLPLMDGRGRCGLGLAVIRQFCAAVVVGVAGQGAVAESPPYVPYSGIIHGTEGAVAVPLRVLNGTGDVIVCEAELAHWYSVDLGAAVMGGLLEVTLWHDPATGRLNLLNEMQDRMPVDAVWCGHKPKVHGTRGRVVLPYVIGTSPAGLDRVCTEGAGGHVVCAGD
jgi:hypothetical protein